MAWDSVPWMVGGGALHSAEVGRLLARMAANDNEGVLRPGDLKVQELAVPGTSVRVAPGACSIHNRAAGQEDQTYIARLPTEDTVPIGSTGAGETRSDLIVARVEDPWLAGEPWSDPGDPTIGPYVFTRVISDVDPSTTSVEDLGLGYSAIALARVDVPESTGTITQGMIVDLREVANPRTKRVLLTWTPSGDVLTQTSYVNWPAAADWQVKIPDWATEVAVRSDFFGMLIPVGNVYGDLRVSIGGEVTQSTGYNCKVAGSQENDRSTWGVADTIAIPSGLRGTTVTVETQGKENGGNVNLNADADSSVSVDLEFREVAA